MLQGHPVHSTRHPGTATAGAGSEADPVAEAYERHHAELIRHAYRLSRDADVAADLVHDAFIRLVDERRAGRQPANVRAWLFRVTTNNAISRARRSRVAAHWVAQQAPPDGEEGPEAAYLDHELATEVEALLGSVSDDERVALLLAAHGVSGEQIAAALGRTNLATRALLFRARGRLRRNVSDVAVWRVA